METSNQKKNRLLGEPYGTATSRLRKMLLFDMARRLKEDICFRCGKIIQTLEEFSIEHTIPWQGTENPKEAFFDIEKIAFSHLVCNSGAGLRYTGIKDTTLHGNSRYDKGCRCAECTKAHSEKGKRWKREVNYRNINKSVCDFLPPCPHSYHH
jgi:hypothetical protein